MSADKFAERIASVIGGLFAGLLVGCMVTLMFGMSPVHRIGPPSNYYRTAEGEHLLDSARSELQVLYDKTGEVPRSLGGTPGVPEGLSDEFAGNSYAVVPMVGYVDQDTVCLYAVTDTIGDPTLVIEFDLDNGEGDVTELVPEPEPEGE